MTPLATVSRECSLREREGRGVVCHYVIGGLRGFWSVCEDCLWTRLCTAVTMTLMAAMSMQLGYPEVLQIWFGEVLAASGALIRVCGVSLVAVPMTPLVAISNFQPDILLYFYGIGPHWCNHMRLYTLTLPTWGKRGLWESAVYWRGVHIEQQSLLKNCFFSANIVLLIVTFSSICHPKSSYL